MKLKNKNTRSPKLKFIVIAVIVLVVLGGGIVAAYTINKANNTATEQKKAGQVSPEGVNYGEPTDAQKQAEVDQKGSTQSDQPAATKPGDPINVVITALNPPTAANPNLQIRVRIDTVTSTGTCTLTLTKGSTTVTKQAGTQAGPSTSTCQGFDVASSELSSGSWNATLKVVNGDSEGSVSQTFTVQ
jgi:cell division protein FtsN